VKDQHRKYEINLHVKKNTVKHGVEDFISTMYCIIGNDKTCKATIHSRLLDDKTIQSDQLEGKAELHEALSLMAAAPNLSNRRTLTIFPNFVSYP
jgi:hypothetical protein